MRCERNVIEQTTNATICSKVFRTDYENVQKISYFKIEAYLYLPTPPALYYMTIICDAGSALNMFYFTNQDRTRVFISLFIYYYISAPTQNRVSLNTNLRKRGSELPVEFKSSLPIKLRFKPVLSDLEVIQCHLCVACQKTRHYTVG